MGKTLLRALTRSLLLVAVVSLFDIIVGPLPLWNVAIIMDTGGP